MLQLASARDNILPAALTVARLLHQHWQAPEQQAADRLELAQAAATRSCAYLRCANLAAEGGPAAGEGASSKRCGICRSVWYCGTQCSHSDWRQGPTGPPSAHKKACQALKAAREQAPAAGPA